MITQEALAAYREKLGQHSTDIDKMLAFLQTGNGGNGITSIYLEGYKYHEQFDQEPRFETLIGYFPHPDGNATLSTCTDSDVPAYVYYSHILNTDATKVPATERDRRIIAENQILTATDGMPAIVIGFGRLPGANRAEIMTLTYIGGMSPQDAFYAMQGAISKTTQQ